MKKSMAIVLLLVVFCSMLSFATSADAVSEGVRGTASKTRYTGYDSKGNKFKIKGRTEASFMYGSAKTTYEVYHYGSGDKSSMYGVDCTVQTDGTVVFSGNTATDYSTLDGFIIYHSGFTDATVWESGAYDAHHTFSVYIVNVQCDHIFFNNNGSGANLTFQTSAIQV